jgi:hypothetical protein
MTGIAILQRRRDMKTLIALAALSAVIATPAIAQQAQRGGPNAVYSGDQYLGADPDPNVRFELRREENWRYGG